MAIANRCLDDFNALLVHRQTKTKIRHHRYNNAIARKLAAFAKIAREKRNELIAVDQFAPFVDGKKAVGVAVERQTKCSTACNHRPL